MSNRLFPTTAALAAALFLGATVVRADEAKHDHKHGDKTEHKDGHKHGHDDGTKEEKVEAAAVPAKVMQAFNKDHPNATAPEIKKETYKDGTVHYEFEWKDADGKEHEAEYNTDGEQLEDH
ncbi:MAG TPA: hypothetical protein VK324_10065 [Tepidisphaeraceae bacterium]|nr:hypothetical protein [Tepidisphaeraceae bacterium]